MLCIVSLSFGNIIFSDDFTGTSINTNFWHIPTWRGNGDGTYLGQTQFRCTPSALPAVGNSNMSVTVQSFNPTGWSIFGTDLISNGPLYVGSGITITARLKVDTVKKGTVFAFFLYGPPANITNTNHDEIDFEFIGNYPNYFSTNLYGNEPLGVGHPQFTQYSGTSAITDYHTYQIVWLPNSVSWYVDGVLIRTVTSAQSPIPQGPMFLHFNAWAPDSSWPDAYSAEMSYVTSPSQNQIWSMSVDSVKVESDPQVLTRIEIDPTEVTLGAGAKQKFDASAIDQNENSIVSPLSLTWTSDNTSVARIDSTGMMTAVGPGTAKITASVGLVKSDPTTVIVPPVSVVIRSVPALGKSGKASGVVNGLGSNYKNYRVAVYINVYGAWWTKPTFASPTVPIASNGAWSANIVTGGLDSQAGEIRAYLIPVGANVPIAYGSNYLPSELDLYLNASYLRTTSVAGSVSPTLRSLVVSTRSLSMYAGGTPQQIFAEPRDTSGKAVSTGLSWASSNTSVATVDSNGLVTPIAYGRATITCSVNVNSRIRATTSVSVAR